MAIDSYVPEDSSRSRFIPVTLSILAAGSLISGCDRSDPQPLGPTAAPAATEFDSQVAVRWLDLLYHAIKTEAFSPPVASRAIGYAGVAFFESVVSGIPDGRSLGGQLNGLAPLPSPPEGGIDWPSAANAALARAIAGLFPTASMPTADAITALEAELSTDRRAAIDSALADRSESYGHDVADLVLEWAGEDGYAEWNNCSFTPPTGPGLWVPTPPAFAPPLQPCWGKLRCFALLYSSQCTPLSFPAYSTDPGSAFCAEATEVYDTVNGLTPEQLAIAQFWADNPGATGTPPGHWISIIEQVCEQQELDLAVAAEATARVGIAVADAFIGCWDMKYHFNLLRPITYIRDPTCPINDPTWVTAPGVGTPPFPEFTSGHSVQSGAASYVLEDLLGSFTYVDDTHAEIGKPARTFSSFTEAADEAAISRLYGGIHYRSAIERGVEQGRCIGATMLDRVQFHQ